MEFDKKVRCVWVDLDDTLIDFEANSRSALRAVYASEGLDRWFPTVEEWVDRYERYNKWLWGEYAAQRISSAKLRLDRFMVPLMEQGCSADVAEAESRRLDPLYLDALAREKRLVEGARELLQWLRSRKYKIGVLSNGFSEVQYRKMDSAGLSGLVDCVVLSDEIGVNKPDRRLFEYAAAKGGFASPEQNVMIGDNPTTDVGGAVAAGWDAIWFDRNASPEPCPEGARRVGRLDEIFSD